MAAGQLVDIVNSGLHGAGILPQSITTTTDSTGVDFKNAGPEIVCMFCELGTLTATSITFTAQQSDSSGSGYAAVTADGNMTGVVTLTASNTIGQVMFQRTKRYVRCEATVTGGPGAGNLVSSRFLSQRKIVNATGGGSSISPQT